MGATCHSETGPGVTHVLAREPGTAKAQWARAAGKFLVAPGWLEGSRFLWKRLEEGQFVVVPKKV